MTQQTFRAAETKKKELLTTVLVLMYASRFLPLILNFLFHRFYRRVGIPKSATPFIFCMRRNAES